MIPNSFPPPADGAGPPKGSLEDLFHHYLADAEVVPRPLVWEQLDNALLVRQNETYRRRLAATRWVAAASLLLATLAGAGWWARQGPPAPIVAVRTAGPADVVRTSAGAPTNADVVPEGSARRGNAGLASNSRATASSTTTGGAAAEATSAVGYLDNGLTRLASAKGIKSAVQRAGGQEAAATAPGSLAATQAVASQLGSASPRQPGRTVAFNAGPWRGNAARATSLRAPSGVFYSADAQAAAATLGSNSLNQMKELWGLLALRPAALAGAPLKHPLPTSLAAVAVVPNVAATPLRRWQFGASYGAGVFQPNVDFSQGSVSTAPTLAYTNSPGVRANILSPTNRSAVEYRKHLRGGLDQRLSLRATRLLGGRWALSTGLEAGQHEAQSATSTGFVGEQLPNYYVAAAPIITAARPTTLRTSTFRYQTVGVPVELRYANPVKRGWSPYGRVGAVVSALLKVRSEVDGEPEATKTYSLTAAGSPYRRLLANLRGGAGMQFRSAAGRWTLAAGPTAELGVLSLNAQPVQDFIHQLRPYSVGLEASIDFGGTVKLP